MFDLVSKIEHAFSSLLTMKNLIAFGGSLMTAALDAVMQSYAIALSLSECMHPVYEAAKREALNQPESRSILERIVNKYVRMRGKDMVKSVLSVLRLTKSAKTALSHRGSLAAASNAASINHKKSRSFVASDDVEETSIGSDIAIIDDDEFSAMDEDLHDARFESDDTDPGVDLITHALDENDQDASGSERNEDDLSVPRVAIMSTSTSASLWEF
jgi:hypothetical protein